MYPYMNISEGSIHLVLQILVHLPVLLPQCDGLLIGPDDLCLAAWRVEGDLSTGDVFRERLQPP